MQINSPAFSRWFKGSKVVDSKGRPLVVYHGTPTAQHSEFRSTKYQHVAGYFAEDRSVASMAAAPALDSERSETGHGAVYPVYLAIQNPVDLSGLDGEKKYTVDEFSDALPFLVPAEVRQQHRDLLAKHGYRDASQVWSLLSRDTFRALMRDHGYDGIIYNEGTVESINELLEPGDEPVKTTRSFIAFEPEQVKSAIGNRGTFDPEDSNILHGLGGARRWMRTPGGR